MNISQTCLFLLLASFSFSFSVAFAQDDELNITSGVQPNSAVALDANYRLATGDQVSVTVFDEPELTVTRAIAGDGRVTLPLIDQIKVSGMTTRSVESAIAKSYQSKRFLKNPQVTVSVVAFAKKTVSILGQVNKPGSIAIPDGQARIELLMAIAKAGDFTGTAKKKKLKLTRKDSDKPVEVNAYDLMEKGSKGAKVYLYPGDVVFVPQSII